MCLKSKLTPEEKRIYLKRLPDVVKVFKYATPSNSEDTWKAQFSHDDARDLLPFHAGLNKAVRKQIGWPERGGPKYISGYHAYTCVRSQSEYSYACYRLITCYIRKEWITDIGMGFACRGTRGSRRVFVCKKMVFPKYPETVADRNHKALIKKPPSASEPEGE